MRERFDLRLLAARVALDWPRSPFYGMVHSVFENVLNIENKPAGLCTLSIKENNFSHSLTGWLKVPSGFGFYKYVSPGASVFYRGGLLRINDSRILVDFRRATRMVSNGETSLKNLQWSVNSKRSWLATWNALRLECRKGGFTDAIRSSTASESRSTFEMTISARVTRFVPLLMKAVYLRNIRNALAFAKELSGIGPGLTPSGDDFLTGYIFGLKNAALTEIDQDFSGQFGFRLLEPKWTSNAIVESFRRDAVTRNRISGLEALCKAIISGADEDILRQEIFEALQFGHTSGADSVFGLLVGLANWESNLMEKIESALIVDETQTF